MENLRQINDKNYQPIKGDNLILNTRTGNLVDIQTFEINWSDNNETEIYPNGWEGFIGDGGFILAI